MKPIIQFILSVVFIFPHLGFSQEKLLTLEDAVYLNPDILPKRMNQLQWMGESNNYSFVKENELLSGKPISRGQRTITNLDDLNAALTDMGSDSLKKFPRIQYLNENTFWFNHKNQLFVYDIIARNIQKKNEYPKEAENIEVNMNNFGIAYTIKNNLYVNLAGQQFQISNDTIDGIVNGQTVHRVEFGINKGIFWSENGGFLAFYHKDESMVTNYPLVNIDARTAEVENIRYPMAGLTSEEVKLGIYNLKTGQTLYVKTGEPKDQYLTSVTWDPSEAYVYIGILNRDQNHLKLNKYDAVSGEFVQNLFEETHPKYVEPEHPLYFLSSKPNHFLWFSERDGYQHLYLYSTQGELIKQITQGEWVVTEFLGEDKRGRNLFFKATKESPIEQHLYAVELKTGAIKRLSPDHGTHFGIPSASGEYFIDSYSSTEIAKEYRIIDKNGKVVQVIQENEDPLKDYNLGEMDIVSLKADDGSNLYGRIIKPMNFDPKKKYPVFFYVYGGPHSQLVSDSWLGAAGIFQNYMAQQGYVVFTMDNHGTANRGLDFEQAIFRNVGDIELADQMKGVEYLRSLDFVDADRMGIDGWSYGGFMTVSMMLRKPGVFKAACAGGPVIDWKYYEVMYGERYMDTPKTNPEGYEKASLLNYVDQLEGDLLILQGTMDPTVVWQNSLNFIKTCVDKGKQVEYFVYPGHGHNVRGKDRVHMYEKIRLFFDEKLK
ncbi:MAG: S9 family peptidase [Bacteroidales bacterium]|nr:S9 family peptidase [Bacteroidales bacterium]MCF8402292.1 S9 family peptidase [Bacteroidales bacterium]